MPTADIVRACAGDLDILGTTGDLKDDLDSIQLVEFIVAVEEATGKAIPLARMTRESFASIASVATLLDQLDSDGR